MNVHRSQGEKFRKHIRKKSEKEEGIKKIVYGNDFAVLNFTYAYQMNRFLHKIKFNWPKDFGYRIFNDAHWQNPRIVIIQPAIKEGE